jgi:hypothetical protein
MKRKFNGHYPPEIEKCSPEARIRLYSLVNALRAEKPPEMDDILWLACYCEVDKKYRRPKEVRGDDK